jgi:hypothetical protein
VNAKTCSAHPATQKENAATRLPQSAAVDESSAEYRGILNGVQGLQASTLMTGATVGIDPLEAHQVGLQRPSTAAG